MPIHASRGYLPERNRVGRARFKAALDRFANVCDGLLARLTLRDTTRQARTLGHEPTVFVLFEGHKEFLRLCHSTNRSAILPGCQVLAMPATRQGSAATVSDVKVYGARSNDRAAARGRKRTG